MSDRTEPVKAGPALPEDVAEVEGIFPNDAALQEAVTQLAQAGFDRAELSLPETGGAPPQHGDRGPVTDTDLRQARTLGTGLAASVAGMAAAGVVVATGGAAALAAGAAAAAGVGAAAVSETAGQAAGSATHAANERAASRGRLVLAVRAVEPARQARARQVMETAGATRVETLRHSGGPISAVP
ncbi:conserved protein of unknown function [Rhodovastum atsumiense]|uniref:Uncharacterized protein n=1 Tax=Rhodovastum atsumiense TaxID=504468 RepID=A0A5M6IKX7_9PROT|nr:hypothetical protein [Rhodovastum atsumiense]KAA5608921.1 hypothetical protein F1189_26670 [Rhodovastum atsumiense]CAH2604226.1 conserved protein of unknown function [Rhodovastum atsumiense]